MAKAFVRPPRQTRTGTVWDLVVPFPADAPADLTQGRGKRSVMFDAELDARNWAMTLNTHGIVSGYRMLLTHLRHAHAQIGASAAAPAPPAVRAHPGRVPAKRERRQGRMRVTEAWRATLEARRLQFRGEDTFNADLDRDFRLYVEPFFGDRWCDEVTAEQILRWRHDLITGVIPRQHREDAIVDELEPLSKPRIKNINIPVKQLFEWALLNACQTGVTGNPSPPLRFPGTLPDPRDAIFLTCEQIEQLQATFRADYLDLIDCWVGLGPRWGELAALRVEHLVVTDTVIRVKVVKSVKHRGRREAGPKNKDKGKRWIQVDPTTRAGQALLRGIEGKRPTDYVFTSPTGARLSNAHFHSRGWIPAMERLRTEFGWTIRPRPYDLRHTCASLMLEAGNELFVVAKTLGHTMAVCEQVYGHLRDRRGLEATQSVDRLLHEFTPTPAPDGDGVMLRVIGDEIMDADEPNVIDFAVMRRRLRAPA